MGRDLFRIKRWLSAPTPGALQKKMLQNNLANKKEYAYETPHLERDGKWYVWYFDSVRPSTVGPGEEEQLGKREVDESVGAKAD